MRTYRLKKKDSNFRSFTKPFINILLLVIMFIVFLSVANAQSDLSKYINDENWNYQNILNLGVGVDWTKNVYAQDQPISKNSAEKKELRKEFKIPLNDENLKIIEEWIRELEWLYEHGLGRTEKAKRLEALLKELLKELMKEYEEKCKGEKAQSEYCKKLADLIRKIEQVLGLGEGTGDTNRTKSPQSTPGGVDISPQPTKSGKGGSETKDKVLKSRPSGDSLSWPVEINK